MDWADLWAFWLLIPLLGLGVWAWQGWKKRSGSLQVSSLQGFQNLPKGLRSHLKHLPLILKIAAGILIIVALARPRLADTRTKKNVEGIDIVIALDVSDSMLIEDMKPLNRMEAAKDTIKNFVEQRSSDRIGVVIFAGEAFTLVPPTLDYPVLLKRVSEITTAANAKIKDGTALGVALANAAGRLKDSQAKTRVIIFMTDGENNSGTIDPETGLEIAKGYGLKVYTIGIGRDGPTRLPTYHVDVFGQRIKSYQPFESYVNEDLLTRIAGETGAKFWRASNENVLASVFNEINNLEKTKIDVNKYTKFTELFQNYLLWAIVAYISAVVLDRTWLRRSLP